MRSNSQIDESTIFDSNDSQIDENTIFDSKSSSTYSVTIGINGTPIEPNTAEEFFDSLYSRKQRTQEEIADKSAVLKCIFNPTFLQESGNVCKEGNIVRNLCINHFYCDAKAFSIGYGSKIELDEAQKNVSPKKGGIDVLSKMPIFILTKDSNNNWVSKPASLDEKKALVKSLLAVRNEYNRTHDKPLSSLSPEDQKKYFMNKCPHEISEEGAFNVSFSEYIDKNQQLSNIYEKFPSNVFVESLISDIAYQWGSGGVKARSEYEKLQQGLLPTTIDSKDNAYPQRKKIREWLLEMATMFEKDAKKRGKNPPTFQSENALLLKGIQSFEKKYHEDLMLRSDVTALLMQKMTALLMIQNYKNLYNCNPSEEELAKIEAASQNLIFNELFASPEIDARIEDKYQTYRRLSAIQHMDVEKLSAQNPVNSIRTAMKDEADLSEKQRAEAAEKKTASNKKQQKTPSKPKKQTAQKQRNKKPSLSALLKSAEQGSNLTDSLSGQGKSVSEEIRIITNTTQFDYTA